MNDELTIISPLDQAIETDNQTILERVEALIQDAIDKKDVHAALNVPKQLVAVQKVSGVALARAMYLIKENWDKFEIEEPFDDVAFSYMGTSKETVRKYYLVEKMHEEDMIPEPYREKISQMNIRDQIPIAYTLDMGYEIEEEDWQELSRAYDAPTIRAITRGIQGKPPRKHALLITLNRDGSLVATKAGEIYEVGWLDVDDADEAVRQAIERIVKNTGIIRQ
jgi:hypothetical protein